MQKQSQKPEIELRGHCVSVRFNPAEMEELDKRRGKIRRGTYLRNMFLGKREPKQIPVPNQKAYSETARWASVLNQIALRLNFGEDMDHEEIRAVLKAFRLSLIGLAESTKEDA